MAKVALPFVIIAMIMTVLLAPLAMYAFAPWLLIGSMGQPVITFLRDLGHGGVPLPLWDIMTNTAQNSSCGVTAEDLAGISQTESQHGANMANNGNHFGWGQFDSATWATNGSGDPFNPSDAIPAIARTLCGRGYGDDRVRALNSYGGCITPLCLGRTDYATLITDLARFFNIPSDIVSLARGYLGTPYVFGGNSRAGIDCSGLVQQVFRQLRIELPRTAAGQYAATQRVNREDLRPGDLVFFANTYMPGISHVGIYIGDGMQINAPTEGQVVSVQPVFSGFWGEHYAGAGRIEFNA